MRLTLHTDYALRMLIYITLQPDRTCTVKDVADAYTLSSNHLNKVAQTLRRLGIVNTRRGRSGGLRLARAPEDINIGTLIRATEDDFSLVECMQTPAGGCRLSPACMLKRMLTEALSAYLDVLDKYTLADVVRNRTVMLHLLGLSNQGAWTIPDVGAADARSAS